MQVFITIHRAEWNQFLQNIPYIGYLLRLEHIITDAFHMVRSSGIKVDVKFWPNDVYALVNQVIIGSDNGCRPVAPFTNMV